MSHGTRQPVKHNRRTTFAAGGLWTDMGNCKACGSTIHKSQVRRLA